MEPKELASRLRAAREARGLSQQHVAEELGLPRTAITQIEAGNRSVSTLELTKLANLYMRSVGQLLRDDEDLLLALYRAEPGLADDPCASEQVQRCVNLCLEGVALERLLGIPTRLGPPNYETRMPATSGEAVSQGEQIAVQERRRLNIGNAPIADISELISSQGIWASGVEFPTDGVSGLFPARPDHRVRHTGERVSRARAQALLVCSRVCACLAGRGPKCQGFEGG